METVSSACSRTGISSAMRYHILRKSTGKSKKKSNPLFWSATSCKPTSGPLRPDTLLREAAEILYRNKYGCLPVLDGDNKLVGIITEADFLRLAIALLHDA